MKAEPGRYLFRQSWVGDFMLCPERARLNIGVEREDEGTEATCLGTAAHLGIETFLKGETWAASQLAAQEWLAQQIHDGTFRWTKAKNGPLLQRDLQSCLSGWHQDIFPKVGAPDPDRGIEHKFEHQLTDSIWIEGTWDYLDEYGMLWDWKTAGGNYKLNYGPKALKKKHQPNFYTAALAGWDAASGSDDTSVTFGYGIMIKGPTPTGVYKHTSRHEGHWVWMLDQLERIVKLYEELGPNTPWPTVDDEWFCSVDWCDHWADCKGKLLNMTHVDLNVRTS